MRVKAALTALGLGVAATVAVVLPTAGPAQAAACPDNVWQPLDRRVDEYFAGNDVNIRTGPSRFCPSVGFGQTTHLAVLDCYKFGDDGFTWSHLTNIDTGRQGWVRDDLLVNAGSNARCLLS